MATADSAPAAPVAGESSAAAPAKRRRGGLRTLLRIVSFTVAAIALLLVLALGGLWIWSGTEGSLRQALQLAARFVPLETQGVTGSIRGGGGGLSASRLAGRPHRGQSHTSGTTASAAKAGRVSCPLLQKKET